MNKNFAVLFCLILCATEIFGLLDFLRAIVEEKDRNITRVRTVAELNERKANGENVVLDFIGLVEQYEGYTAEEYDVQTEDGYILKLHRISGSPSSPAASGKPVVYLQHGLFGSSDFHVILGSSQALTFLLADEGYDVWLGNLRGSTYSKRHVNKSSLSNNYDYWNFSMDEMGAIDVPAFIDTVLEKTNQEKLTYIGYSLGTSVSYVTLTEKPEYNSKMNLVLSIPPVAYFTKPYSSHVKRLLVIEPILDKLAEASKYYEILPQTKLLQIVGENVCDTTLGKLFCKAFFNSKNMNTSVIPNFVAYCPAGASLHAVNQYYQMITAGAFRKYDFGEDTNLEKYGSSEPPQYNFSKITAPVALYYADEDTYVSPEAAAIMRDALPNVVIFQEAPSGYNHLDFMMSMDVRDVFYGQILDGIKKYT